VRPGPGTPFAGVPGGCNDSQVSPPASSRRRDPGWTGVRGRGM